MSSPIETINVECPRCGNRYEAQFRASMNLGLDTFDPAYVKEMSTGVCPQCGSEVALGSLIVETDGTWRVSQVGKHRKSGTRGDGRLDNQLVGNVGLFYVCYRLSRLGWNCMPTARNARGIDVLMYNHDNSRKLSIQVKTLSKPAPVPLGNHLRHLFADYVIVCSNVAAGQPACYILETSEVRKLAQRREKDTRVSYWLQPKSYATPACQEAWQRIGVGSPHTPFGLESTLAGS